MNISDKGLDLIRSYEGYAKELKDGSGRCTAYQEKINGKLDKPTIGYGCTRGVTMGMVWTREEAESALRREIAIHEKRVSRLVTVDLNENEFSALCSFDFNCGGLTNDYGKPTGVLRAINCGDRAATADELKRWNKFNGKVSDGLVARRAAEIALFLKPAEPIEPDYMPQAPEPEKRPVSTSTKITTGAVAGGAALQGTKAAVEQGKEIKSTIEDAKTLIPPKADLPLYGGVLLAIAALAFFLMHRRSA